MPRGRPQPSAASSAPPSSRSSAARRRGSVDQQAADAVLDRVRRARRPPSPPPAGRRPSPRARRSRSPRAATGRRRRPHARSTGRARECGTNPTASGTSTGPAPTITRGRPAVAARNSWIPFSGERRPTKSTCGGSSGSPTVSGISTPLGITRTSRAPSSRAALARNSRGRDREPRPAQDRPEEPRRAPRDLDIRPPELDDVRLAGRERGEAGREPVRVDEVGIPRSPPRRQCEADEEGRQEQREPRPPAQVADDPVPVRDPEVPERRRRDDLDLHSLRPHRLDRVTDEEPRHVPLVPRVRGRQDDDLHWRRRANTIGAASASIANAKK